MNDTCRHIFAQAQQCLHDARCDFTYLLTVAIFCFSKPFKKHNFPFIRIRKFLIDARTGLMSNAGYFCFYIVSIFFYFCFCRLSLVSVSVFVGGLSFKQNYHSSQFSFLLQFYACLNRRDQSYKHSKIENYSRLYLDSYWLQDSSHCDSLESSFVTVEHFKLANRYCITCHVLTS